ncbi:Eukaryotic translation initiation factor 4E type 3 [Actinomortierella ambigua]|nr:Eukaryotic translation initiation factor 4E type 3 [Actinomortierella ambigua]
MPPSVVSQQGTVQLPSSSTDSAAAAVADVPESQTSAGKDDNPDAARKLSQMALIPLKHEWVFWHDKYVANATPAEYTENLREISDVNSVQAFWSVYNNIKGPESLSLRYSLHVIRKGIKPLWEDPLNERGGAWNFRTSKADAAFVWRELLMALIGEQFEDTIAEGDEIFGLSVSARWNSDIFQIWNKDSSLKDQSTVMVKVKEILKGIELQSPFYKAHKDHDHFNSTTK